MNNKTVKTVKIGQVRKPDYEVKHTETEVLKDLIYLIQEETDPRLRYYSLETFADQIDTTLLIFCPRLRVIIDSLCSTFQTPTPFYIAGVFSALSCAIGKNITIKDGRGVTEKAALYMCVISDSGTGKTPSLSWCIDPIKQIESENYKAYQRKKQEAEANDEILKDTHKTHYLTDSTTEALTKQLQESHTVLYFRDELIGWLKDMNKYRQGGGSDDLLFMQIWNSNDTIRVERQSKSIFIENPYLNVLGGTQPRRLEEFLKKAATDSGFFQRILFIYPTAKIQDRLNAKEDKEAKADYFETITKIFNNCKDETHVFELSDESNEYVTTFVNKFIRTQQRFFKSDDLHAETLSKLETYILRFALIHHLTDSDAENFTQYVTHKSVVKAVATVLYFYSHAVKVLQHSKQFEKYENESDRVIHTILSKKRQAGDIFTTKNALELCGRYVSKVTLIKHLKNSQLYDKVSRGTYEMI